MTQYEDFYEIEDVSFLCFDWSKYWIGETDVLEPQLVALGYSDFTWKMGEADSFGPLTRICICRDSSGELHRFIYG